MTDGLDLDALERDGTHPGPFIFTLGGKQWTIKDPEEVDWQVAYDLNPEDVRAVLTAYMDPEQYAEFAKVELPTWKLSALVDAMNKHYETTPADVGEGVAS